MRRHSLRARPARRYVRVTRLPSVVRTGGGEGHGCLVAERTVRRRWLWSSFQSVITTGLGQAPEDVDVQALVADGSSPTRATSRVAASSRLSVEFSYPASGSVRRDGCRELPAGHEGARITAAARTRALRMLASRSPRSTRSGVWSACRLV